MPRSPGRGSVQSQQAQALRSLSFSSFCLLLLPFLLLFLFLPFSPSLFPLYFSSFVCCETGSLVAQVGLKLTILSDDDLPIFLSPPPTLLLTRGFSDDFCIPNLPQEKAACVPEVVGNLEMS